MLTLHSCLYHHDTQSHKITVTYAQHYWYDRVYCGKYCICMLSLVMFVIDRASVINVQYYIGVSRHLSRSHQHLYYSSIYAYVYTTARISLIVSTTGWSLTAAALPPICILRSCTHVHESSCVDLLQNNISNFCNHPLIYYVSV